MVKKTIILLVLYFWQFYLTSLREKEYFAKLNQLSGAGAGFFGPLEPEPLEKKNTSRSRSRTRLGKKSGAGAARKKKSGAGAGAAPQPCEECKQNMKIRGSKLLTFITIHFRK